MYKHASAARPSGGILLHNPLNYPCPVCKVNEGERCRDKNGRVIAGHRSRNYDNIKRLQRHK